MGVWGGGTGRLRAARGRWPIADDRCLVPGDGWLGRQDAGRGVRVGWLAWIGALKRPRRGDGWGVCAGQVARLGPKMTGPRSRCAGLPSFQLAGADTPPIPSTRTDACGWRTGVWATMRVGRRNARPAGPGRVPKANHGWLGPLGAGFAWHGRAPAVGGTGVCATVRVWEAWCGGYDGTRGGSAGGVRLVWAGVAAVVGRGTGRREVSIGRNSAAGRGR